MPNLVSSSRANVIVTETFIVTKDGRTFFDGSGIPPLRCEEVKGWDKENIIILGIRALVLAPRGNTGEGVYLTIRDDDRKFFENVPVASFPNSTTAFQLEKGDEKGVFIFMRPLVVLKQFLIDVRSPVEDCEVRITAYGLHKKPGR